MREWRHRPEWRKKLLIQCCSLNSGFHPRRFYFKLLRGNDCLSTGVHTKLAQNRRDMRLDGRLTDTELISYLLIEQPFSEHIEHSELLWRQRSNRLSKACFLLARLSQRLGKLSG